MSVVTKRAVATPPGVLRNLVVVLVVAACSAWLGVDSAHADFTLRCYDWRDRAPWAARVYVSEGDQFVINLKWNEYSAGNSWVAEWNTRRGSGGTATSDTDYEPRDSNSQTKRTGDNMNHTFSTVEDDRYEGDETYEAGYSFAGGGHDIDYHEYCPVTIEDDDDLKVDSVWFRSTPDDGHTYRAGEWIEIAAKFNGRAAVDGESFLAFFFRNYPITQYREAPYRRGSGTDTLVFGYQVDVRDRNVDFRVQPRGDTILGSGTIYGIWTNGTYHREDTALRSLPAGDGEDLSVDGRRYVRSVSVTSRPRVGDTYGRGETVEVQVTFDREVVVSGVPVVGLTVGGAWRGAGYVSGSGTRVLTLHYEVGEGHTDTDGISIRTSNSAGTHGFVGIGSSITDEEFGITANRAYSAQSNLSGHKVDGTVEQVPSGPVDLTAGAATPTTVRLSWTAPKFDGATAVTGYKVEWSADGNDPWMVAEADTASTSTSYTHTGRTPQTTYHYRVSAINSVGASEASESVSATTPALPVVTISASVDTGGNPVTAVTEGNDARFTLTFTGNVTELSRVDAGLEVQGDFFAGSEATFYWSDLPGGHVEAHVVATTTADALDEADGWVTVTLFPGDGYTLGRPKSATVTILDDDEVPGAIGALVASPGDERVILSWSPPMDAGTSPIAGFDYRVSDDAGMNWSSWTDTGVDPGATNPAHTVTNLDNGTPYTFEVQARSAAGNGPPSNRATGTPLPPPVLTSIELTSDAGSDDTYAIGDDIVATVTFDRTLELDTANGTPALVLTIGNGTGDATCALATDTKKLECTYTVVGDDEDTDGVSIGANRLALNGGRIHGIHGATGGDAELAHAALGSDGSHKVDGVRPTPANASVNGIALTLEWSEPLDTGSAPAAGQFVLGVDSGTAPAVSSLTMSGTTMTLTLASAADATRGYTLAYTVPSSNPVKDLAGNEAVAFTGTGIETVQITWSFTLTSPRSDGAGNPLVVEGGATATATVSITNAVTTTVAQTVKLQWDGSDIGGDGEPGRLLTIAGVVGPTITVPAGAQSASAVIRVRQDALYAPTHTAAFTATHLGTEIGSVDLTLTDDDAPPVMTIAVSASPAASDTRMSAITINEGEGFHLEITLDRGFATFQPPLGSAVTVTAPSGTFNAADLASLPPSFARDIKTFGTTIDSSDNTTAAGAVDAVFAIASGCGREVHGRDAGIGDGADTRQRRRPDEAAQPHRKGRRPRGRAPLGAARVVRRHRAHRIPVPRTRARRRLEPGLDAHPAQRGDDDEPHRDGTDQQHPIHLRGAGHQQQGRRARGEGRGEAARRRDTRHEPQRRRRRQHHAEDPPAGGAVRRGRGEGPDHRAREPGWRRPGSRGNGLHLAQGNDTARAFGPGVRRADALRSTAPLHPAHAPIAPRAHADARDHRGRAGRMPRRALRLRLDPRRGGPGEPLANRRRPQALGQYLHRRRRPACEARKRTDRRGDRHPHLRQGDRPDRGGRARGPGPRPGLPPAAAEELFHDVAQRRHRDRRGEAHPGSRSTWHGGATGRDPAQAPTQAASCSPDAPSP